MNQPAIKVSHLTKDFHMGVRGVKLRAVEDLNLEVGDNQIFGLLGPNGCGKSTTMKIILGLIEPTVGDCEIFGVPSKSVRSRRDVGFLPEAPYFYRYLTGRELVGFYGRICGLPRSQLKARVEEVLDLVDMMEAADRRVGTYSKGMLQRIGIAQAVVHDPRLVILDEPTAGVDPIGSDAIARMILSLKERGKTVLLCSHLLAQVEGVCDRVAIMNRGSLVLEGEVSELLQRQDMRSLIVENFPAAAEAEVRAVLEKHGARLDRVEPPRISLDQLFLNHVREPAADKQGKEPRP